MASTESKIKLIFDGTAKGVVAASREAAAAVRSVGGENDRLSNSASKAGLGLASVGAGLAKIGAVGGAVQTVGGVAGALTQLAPAALLLPGALLAGAAAMQTFKLATAGFGEAVGAGLSGDLEAFAEATKKMHPEMAKAAAEVVKFKPQIDALKRTVQGEFWDSFSVQVKQLGDNYLPVLTDGLATVAREMGGVAYAAAEAMNLPATVNDVNEVLNGTSGFLREVGEGVGDLIRGFTGLAGVGATYLPRLGEAIGGVSKRFREWVDSGVESGRIIELIDGAIAGFRDLGGIVKNVGSSIGSIFRGLGTDMRSPLASLRELTGQVAAFLKTAAAQDGLRALGETLRVVGDVVGRVVMTALKELAPTLVELAPVAQEVARTLGNLLVSALETLGPLIRGVASVLGDFPGVVGLATVAVVGFVAAVKTMQIVNQVSGWLNAAGVAFAGTGDKAAAAGGKLGVFRSHLGLIKGVAAAAAIGVVAVELDKVNASAAGGADKLGLFEGQLHNIVGAAGQIGSGDFAGIFADIGSELDEVGRKFASGESAFGKMWGSIKRSMQEPLPPITFNVDDGPGRTQIRDFLTSVNNSVGTVNINGNDNPAGFALREILSEIDAGKGTVRIDGEDMPAQQALSYVIGLINNGAGTVDINGNRVPAGQALAGFLGQANRSRATVAVGANTAGANASVSDFVARWRGYTIRMNAVVSSRIGGLAGGGPGGPVSGPGTGTSDTAGLYALSNGEHVLTAKEVANAGGHDKIMKLREMLAKGPILGLAAGGSPMQATARAAMRTPAAPSGPGSPGGAQVSFTGNTSDALATVIMQMIRTNKIQIKAA